MTHPYRTREGVDPQLQGWRPHIPLSLVRIWRSKRFRYHASAWGFSLTVNTGSQLFFWSILGRFTMPTPIPWKYVLGMFLLSMALLRAAWAFFKTTEQERSV